MNDYCAIALLSPPYHTLTYTIPPWLPRTVWKPGLRIAILLGNKNILRTGVLVSFVSTKTYFPPHITLRPLLWPLEKKPLFSCEYIQMIEELALRQATYPGKILATILPPGLRSVNIQMKMHHHDFSSTSIPIKKLKDKSENELKELGTYWQSGNIEYILTVNKTNALSELYIVTMDPPWPIRPSAHRQRIILDFLFEHGPITKKELLFNIGKTFNRTLNDLIQRGIISVQHTKELDEKHIENTVQLLPPSIYASPHHLTHEQQRAIEKITESLLTPQAETLLLFGVTGSGKTAVYLETIQVCLHYNRSVLLLAPEVALAHKLKQDVSSRFSDVPCYLVHGYQKSQYKEHVFREIAYQKRSHIIIGTRSALFLPFTNLGAIILDEEHDASFKQDERLLYQAKEIAWFRTVQSKGVLVLGSATPDIKTFYAAEQSHLSIMNLPVRIGTSIMPSIKLIDIRKTALKDSIFAYESLQGLKETIQSGEQAIILLNRRGYAPTIYCIACGKSIRCPHCDVGMTYHKIKERLICHYCAYSTVFPSPCPNCGGIQFHPVGQGTEKIEEEIHTILPSTTVLRFDRDTTRRPGRSEEILLSFARKEAQILVGTQMLSKGHHFPNVTLVIIANGDIGLNIPDYRAAEKTFQLLIQSAGRAGRGEKPGQVFIQTHDVSHYCWKFIQQHDYVGFYQHEIALRKKWHYPPFTRLALIRFSYPTAWNEGKDWLKRISMIVQSCNKKMDISIRGPVASPIPFIQGRNRFQCLLKGPNWQIIRAVFHQIRSLTVPKKFRVTLDIDPIDML